MCTGGLHRNRAGCRSVWKSVAVSAQMIGGGAQVEMLRPVLTLTIPDNISVFPQSSPLTQRSSSPRPSHHPPAHTSPCLQVVVHNLPWSCTWQQLKDHFQDYNVERADLVLDATGRSRCGMGCGV